MTLIGRSLTVAAAVSLLGLSGIPAAAATAKLAGRSRTCAAAVRAACMNGSEASDKDTPIHGSIKVEGRPSEGELAKLAKISKSDAMKIALKDVQAKAEDKKVTDSELEVEDGYLVYSIELTVKGRTGIEEILVDAGNGKILSREHEDETDEEGAADEPDDSGDDHDD